MLSRYGILACTLVLFLALSACDSTDSGDAGDVLTEQEADALLSILVSNFRGALSINETEEAGPDVDPTGSGGAPMGDGSDAIRIDTTYACSGGGTAAIGGKARPVLSEGDSNSLTLDYDISQFATDCIATVDNATFEMDIYYGVREFGSFSLETLETDTSIAFVFTRKSAMTGELVWETAGRSGACDVALSTDESIKIPLLGLSPFPESTEESPFVVEGGTSGTICSVPVEIAPEAGELVDLEEDPEGQDMSTSGSSLGKYLRRR